MDFDYEFAKVFEEPEENIFLSEEQKVETFELEKSHIALQIQSRKVHMGISRVVWKASLVMAQWIEDLLYETVNPEAMKLMKGFKEETKSILELGSGTGLGGLFVQV